MNSLKKLLVGAALGAFGVAALSGCSPASGTAAVVNGVVIPDSRITDYSEGCAVVLASQPQLQMTANELRPQMVMWAVLGEMSSQQAAQMGADAPTDAQVRDYMQQLGLGVLLTDERCAQAALGIARSDLIASGLGLQSASYLGAYDVELNPRYGNWDPANLTLAGSGSLSELAQS